jgi:hypothetical protein
MEPEKFQQVFKRLEAEVRKVIVGHDDVIRQVLIAFCRGHVLEACRVWARHCW